VDDEDAVGGVDDVAGDEDVVDEDDGDRVLHEWDDGGFDAEDCDDDDFLDEHSVVHVGDASGVVVVKVTFQIVGGEDVIDDGVDDGALVVVVVVAVACALDILVTLQ